MLNICQQQNTKTSQSTQIPLIMGALKMLDVKMTDVKLTDQFAGHEIAGRENAGLK